MTEKCSACTQMKTENASVRKALSDTNRNYVEVINRVLQLEKFIRDSGLDVPWEEYKEDK